jgi:hypothetical protein
MIRLSGKNIDIPLQNVHIPVTVGNIVTFSYTLHTNRAPSSSTVSIHHVRHDVDWLNNTYAIGFEKSMYFFLCLNLTDFKKKKILQSTNFFLKSMQKVMDLIHLFLKIGILSLQHPLALYQYFPFNLFRVA